GSVFLQRRGPDALEHVASTGVSFTLDRSSISLQISKHDAGSDEKIRFSISQILTYKLLERTQLSFPKALK
ncbi:MAG: hypothetical protein WCK42_00525, partial [Myxococcaceae bacterium]